MTLLESSIESRGYRCEVLGTDVSTHALDRARAGQYPARAFSNLSQDIIRRWFEPAMGGQRPVQRVRDIVDFSYHNLVKEPYPLKLLSNWDVIFCRNVTIYFRSESTRRVIENFYQSLNPGGYLFIGHSETLSTISDRFEPLEINGVFLYRKPLVRRSYAIGDASLPRGAEGRKSSADRASLATASTPAHSDGAGRAAAPPALAGSELPGDAVVTPSTQSGAEAVSRADALVGEAYALLEQGRPADARVLAERALLLDARNVEAMLARAYAHADAGDFSAAIAESTAALGIDPLLAPARYILGIIYQRQGDANAALAEFKRTIYIDNDFVVAHFNAANIYRARGAMEDACREYENTLRALYLNPEGSWVVFLGGFRPDLLAKTCERSLIECRRGS